MTLGIRLLRTVFYRMETNSECSMTWITSAAEESVHAGSGSWWREMMNERPLSRQEPAAIRQRAEELRKMAEAARTEGDVRSLRVLADRFDRFAEHLETAGFRRRDGGDFVLARHAEN